MTNNIRPATTPATATATPNASPTLTTEIVMPGVVEPDGFQIRRRMLPAPSRGQARVRVEASGISFAEQSMRRGRYPGQPAFPFVPGYDLVGVVEAVGPGVDSALIGGRVAAATKTGGWASEALVPAADLVPVPAGLDPAIIESVIVNGITAWQMLHRKARVESGQTILVHGASGGVGTILVQLARHAGIRVIGTAAPRHHEALRGLGVEPVDYSDPDLAARVRELAPSGVHAAFDHLGLASARISKSLLARGGTLVSYGIASALKDTGSLLPLFIGLLARLTLWNTLPGGHRALFYDFWAGHRVTPAAYRRHHREDLTAVLDLVARGIVTPQIAARFPLVEAAAAMRLAESRSALGKVILIP
ncbi:NADPH:quinone reductase [Cryobacterium sp. MDB1-18-2]|uniref:medium chain dehydrogenase/reductase family protein n=1 Tax=unclassified Cryobacterium TaxID=2649013 RepID=UPI00106C8448|nr:MULTISPECIES: medium chain dehydrogenase/reductase family protein [unclassified Cryobacterium]TFC31568.1 NADPH:quinone reductase [Cryobacterium sp. MDB1-18-2]TFC38185.1 NADPH:quinone reductase [Cryobacterium sp. MDB1-18-1]